MRTPYSDIAGYKTTFGIVCPDCADDISNSDDAPDYLEPALASYFTSDDRCCDCAVRLPNTYTFSPSALAHFTSVSAPRQRAALIEAAKAHHDPVTGLYQSGDFVVNVRTRKVTTSNEPNPPVEAAIIPDYRLTDAAWLQLERAAAGNAQHGQQMIRRMVRVLESHAGMLCYSAHGVVAIKRTQMIMTEAEAASKQATGQATRHAI